MTKAIVIGSSGYIGKALCRVLDGSCAVVRANSSGVDGSLKVDLSSPENFDCSVVDCGDIVYMLAAISAPDICDLNRAHAWRINVEATEHVLRKCLSRGGRIVFASSDAIYGEAKLAVTENYDPRPVGAYAEMKWEIEKRFLDCPNFKSVRLSYVFSRDDKFTRYLASSVENGHVAQVYPALDRAVIARKTVVAALRAIRDKWKNLGARTINLGGPETVSRLRLAEVIKKTAMPDLKIEIVDPPKGFFDKRPEIINMQSSFTSILEMQAPANIDEVVRLEMISRT